MMKINTIKHNERMSTQDLLLMIEAAVKAGETEFDIAASGQHDIGGPLWHPDGRTLKFHVTNAGQRVGSMCLPNTEIIVEGSTSADVGWLNSGGIITVKGDAGDTAGHCSSGGKIYIGGRAGTRTGSLMKHDPLYEEPELWVLKNVGSFSFEFMGGGRAVVCGVDSEEFSSVLGERACVGMVGGVVYVRGKISDYPADILCLELDADDVKFLKSGMNHFLNAVEKSELIGELSDWQQWKKLRPLTFEEKKPQVLPDLAAFRKSDWVSGGIFSDVANDDFIVLNTVNRGVYRLRVPSWDNAKFSAPCQFFCPIGIPTQQRLALLRQGKIDEALKLVLKYTPFPGSVCGTLCPNPCMEGCTRSTIDEAIKIGELGLQSANVEINPPVVSTGKHVAIIGGGVAGLSAAWQLRLRWHEVTVFDDAAQIGGKLAQVIPHSRISHELIVAELNRIEKLGVKFVTSCKVDAGKFQEICDESDAVLVATGGNKARYFNWEGAELLTHGIEFLKAINRGEKVHVGKNVVVIGGGNSGMDVATSAYEQGAEKVIVVDVVKPAAFAKEIRRLENFGGKIVWPFVTKKITDEGIYSDDGRFIAADQVIVSIGEAPVLDFLPEVKKFRDWLVPNAEKKILPKVFAAGDVIKPGRLTDATGDARLTALAIDKYLRGEEISLPVKKNLVPDKNLSKKYFEKCHHCDLPDPLHEHLRCVSCGACRDCKMCLNSCPEKAISRIEHDDGSWEYVSDENKCIGCGICAGVCPCGVWNLCDNTEEIKLYKT
ncbi:MAG: FAD-dependent oxidoreductase, partial [Selenomonadaceae bacterium]|nr:FAD-dependent oxidoreductase [Selenomonadaceae bacterium]